MLNSLNHFQMFRPNSFVSYLSDAVVCELGYLIMWSGLPSAFTPRLLTSIAISNSLSNLPSLHGFIIA